MAHSVYYVRRGIALNLTEPDLGHPEIPELWDEVYPTVPKIGNRGLQCLQCLDERGPSCPEYMYLQVRDGLRVAVHHNTSIRAHAAGESDEHKALKERTATTVESAGFRAEVEDRAVHGRRRTDITIYGAEGSRLGVEIQLAYVSSGSVRTRTRTAVEDGITLLWAVNDPNAHPIHRAPWCRIPNADWRAYRSDVALMAQGGIRHLAWLDCTEIVRRGGRCPTSRKLKPCGGQHPDWAPVRVRYDELVTKAAALEYVPIHLTSGKYFWVPAGHRDAYSSEFGEVGLSSPAAHARGQVAVAPRDLSTICTYGVDTGIRATPGAPRDTEVQIDAPVSGLCCGEKPVGRVGQPLVLSCQLCPKSPTYWRKVRDRSQR